MTKDKTITIEFTDKTNKLIADSIICPNSSCTGKHFSAHVSYVQIPCRKCGMTFKTDFNQKILTKKSIDILKAQAFADTIIFKVDEKFESDLRFTKDLFQMMKSYQVSELKRTFNEYRRCTKCATCLNCFTCKQCGKSFEKEKHKKKMRCPHCNHNKYVNTYVKEIICSKENENIKLCSHCKSDKIIMTRSKTKSKCHICSSKKLSEKRSEVKLELTIKRKGAYKL